METNPIVLFFKESPLKAFRTRILKYVGSGPEKQYAYLNIYYWYQIRYYILIVLPLLLSRLGLGLGSVFWPELGLGFEVSTAQKHQ